MCLSCGIAPFVVLSAIGKWVSPSYLSQVQNGKRPPSQKLLCNKQVLSKVLSNFKQNRNSIDAHRATYYNNFICAGVAELAYAADLKSAGAILVGSSPTLGTI